MPKDKDSKINIQDQASVIPEVVVAAGAVVAVPPAIANKITPGRKMRDSARLGSHTGNKPGDSRGRSGGRTGGRGGEPRERVKPEFDAKMIDIRRVTRVSSGGRRYSFSVAVVAGDRKGRVGVGLGKALDTSLAIEKATREAKKHLVKITLSPQMTIPHATEAKFGSARIMVFPARGSGIVAGSSARTVIELAGVRDICAKIMSGSKNKVNIARAVILALDNLSKINRRTLQGRPAKEVKVAATK